MRWCVGLLVSLAVLQFVLILVLMRPYLAQRAALKRVEKAGFAYMAEPEGPRWLRNIFGPGYFEKVHAVSPPIHEFAGHPLGGSWGDLESRDLEQLGALRGLRYLDLWRTSAGDAELAIIAARLPDLEHLGLADTAVTDEGLKHLPTLIRLRHLDVRNTLISTEGVRSLEESFPSMVIEW